MAGTLTRVNPALGPVDPGGQDDVALAALVAEGDEGALAALYDRYGSLCYSVALKVTANRALAEEAVQEAFLAFWREGGYRNARGPVRGFLVALCHHKAVDAVRREGSRARREGTYAALEPSTDDGEVGVEIAAHDARRDGAVRSALGTLAPAQREVLELAYFGGRTQREIAELIGIPLGTVKTRMFAAMRRLQAELAAFAAASEEGLS